MFRLLLLTLIFGGIGRLPILSSQNNSGWQDWNSLYNDSYITVEIRFYLSRTNNCQNNGKDFKWEYRVRGKYRSSPYFVNWRLEYEDCHGNLMFQMQSFPIWKQISEDISNWQTVPSLDDRLTAQSLTLQNFEASGSSQRRNETGTVARPKSTDPKGISGKRKVFWGEEVELSVEGGSLGIGAEWYWYRDACGGKSIGKSRSIKIAPTENLKIFVQAIGKNNTTQCTSIEIEVDKRSQAPKRIAGDENICRGTATTLTVEGGSLGEGANWVWYSGSCGGKKIGTGSSIRVQPTEKTNYFVRAEGTLNTTECAILSVSVQGNSTEPVRANISSALVCKGQTVELSVQGGSLAGDAEWQWFEGSCGAKQIGTGARITLTAQKSSTFFVQARGVCNTTKCTSVALQVDSCVLFCL